MKYRQLGDSDLVVSEIALGTWLNFGGARPVYRGDECLSAAFDCGINFIDTANVYAKGGAEAFLGKALSRYPRDSYVLGTKLYFPMSEHDRGLSRDQIHKQIDESLRRLRTDYVDLYQCHRYDEDTPLDETLAALTEVVKAGKARHIGFSEWSVEQIQASLELPDVTQFVSSQPQYSMLWRSPEAEIIPLCRKNGIGQIVWSPLAQGVLSGKYLQGKSPPANSRANDAAINDFMRELQTPAVMSRVQRLEAIAHDAGITMAQLALAWVLREPSVSAAIIGASRPEQVYENAAAAGKQLSTDVLAAIELVLQDRTPDDTAPPAN